MYSELINKIIKYDNIVITRHVGVDPDALCSQLALKESILLTFPNKNVFAIGAGSLKFHMIGQLDKLDKLLDLNKTLLIVCDTPDKKRVDGAIISDYGFSIKIDHHPFLEKYCDLEIIEDDKTSACEIIMNIINDTILKCNSSIFEKLYLGLVSDSNRFMFNNCNYNTFSLVSSFLKKYPFELNKAYEKIYLRPMNEVKLEGYISLNMTITEYGLGYIIITDDIIKSFDVDSASAGNIINNFNFINEVLVWAFISEDVRNKQYRISIRSRGPVINTVAEKYNGGGHKYASGIRIHDFYEINNIINDLNLELSHYLKKEDEVI